VINFSHIFPQLCLHSIYFRTKLTKSPAVAEIADRTAVEIIFWGRSLRSSGRCVTVAKTAVNNQTAVNHKIYCCTSGRTEGQQESCAIAKTTARCALYIAALKIFESPWLRSRPLVSIIFNGLLLEFSLRSFRPNLKFIALSVPEVIEGTQKIGQSLDTPTPLCLKIFYGLLLELSLRMLRPNLKFIALSVPEIIGCTA